MSGIKQKLAAGRACLGTYVTLPSPEIVEIFGAAGMDYVIIDLQHSAPSWDTLRHMIRAAEVVGVAPVVRVPDGETTRILRILELGAEGISIPGISSSAELQAITQACFYKPLGNRGSCGHTRVGRYNPDRAEFAEHMRAQNERVFVWALVENPQALLQVEELVAVEPAPTIISVGRGDLSVAIGRPGQIDHPEVIAATERVIANVSSSSSGRCFSSVMVHAADEIGFWHERGARLFTYSADAPLLSKLVRGLVAEFRTSLGDSSSA